jgi:hypothetical protein
MQLYREGEPRYQLLVALADLAPSKQKAPFFSLNAETSFFKLQEPGPFKLTLKTSAIVWEVMTVRMIPVPTPPPPTPICLAYNEKQDKEHMGSVSLK